MSFISSQLSNHLPHKRSFDQEFIHSPLTRASVQDREKRQKIDTIRNLNHLFLSVKKTFFKPPEESLSEIYQFDFLHPKKSENAEHFFAIRDAALLIESWVAKHPEFQDPLA